MAEHRTPPSLRNLQLSIPHLPQENGYTWSLPVIVWLPPGAVRTDRLRFVREPRLNGGETNTKGSRPFVFACGNNFLTLLATKTSESAGLFHFISRKIRVPSRSWLSTLRSREITKTKQPSHQKNTPSSKNRSNSRQNTTNRWSR